MTAFYNEIDPFAADWLRNLIDAGHIAPGIVDERSIVELEPSDLEGFTQVHLFAGIGVWSHALRLAGWSDDRPVWTGSCPCQPFSTAGKRKGTDDERHLWPHFFRLIQGCRPPVIFGEQVASKDGLAWMSGEDPPLQEMRDREAVQRVLLQLEGKSSHVVQRLRSEGGAYSKEVEPEEDCLQSSPMAAGEERVCPDERGKAPRKEKESALQHRPEGHPTSNRRGNVRIDGDQVRLRETTGMERSVLGPDTTRKGVYDGQRESSSLCGQRDGEHMGAESDLGDCVGDLSDKAGQERASSMLSELRNSRSPEEQRIKSVQADLEGAGYAVGAADLCAASVGAPHIRQRLYFVAESAGARREGLGTERGLGEGGEEVEARGPGALGGLADGASQRWGEEREDYRGSDEGDRPQGGSAGSNPNCPNRGLADVCSPGARRDAGADNRGGVADGSRERLHGRQDSAGPRGRDRVEDGGDLGRMGQSDVERREGERLHVRWRGSLEDLLEAPRDGEVGGFWSPADWVLCRDPGGPRWRPVEPGTFPLAHGPASRVGRLRAYGNAIVAPLAAEFVRAYMDAAPSIPSS